MNFQDVVKKRYSCRKYSEKPVPRELLQEIMEDGRLSPSSCNTQSWVFIAIDEPEKIKSLSDVMRYDEIRVNTFTENLPALIAIVARPPKNLTDSQKILLENHQSEWLSIDIGIAAQQMILSATDKGLGSVAIGWFDHEKVKEILEVPKELDIPLFIGLGYPQDDKERKHIRLEKEESIRFNCY